MAICLSLLSGYGCSRQAVSLKSSETDSTPFFNTESAPYTDDSDNPYGSDFYTDYEEITDAASGDSNTFDTYPDSETDAITSDDNPGPCGGIWCDMPPPPKCLNENTLLVYNETGICVKDNCAYEYDAVDCLYGCFENTCNTELEPCDGSDQDSDGTIDCQDLCPADPNKVTPGTCGCGFADADRDRDGALDCQDGCPSDPNKIEPGECGCGTPDGKSGGNSTIRLLVHGPPTSPQKSAKGIYLNIVGEPHPVSLMEVGPALWMGFVQRPRISSIDYYYSREPSKSTAEVGPWGEPIALRRLSVGCKNISTEDTVWNWDDLTTEGIPSPPEFGPTLSVVKYNSMNAAAITVSLASIENATLHVSQSPFLPNRRGGYFTFGRELRKFGSGDDHYEFEMTKLRPGTTYYYYMEYGGRVTSQQKWTTGAADKPFRLIAYGDSQDITPRLHEIHRGIVNAVYSKHPNIIIRTGDIVEDGGNRDYWSYLFAIERPVLGSAIYLPTAGNHEYWSWDDAADYFANFALPPSSPGKERYYAVKHNSALFIALNTELGSLEEQEAWLKETLANAKNDPHIKWKFIFFHRPAFSSGLHGSEPGLKETWHDDFVEYGVDVVLSGHDHEYEHLLVDGIHYFVIGGAGSYLRNFILEPLPETIYREKTYHYLVVDVKKEKLDLTAYRDNGSKMEHLVLHAPPPIL